MKTAPATVPGGRGRRLLGHVLAPLLAAGATALHAQSTQAADASVYFLMPKVSQGEREIDWHAGVGSAGATTPHEQDMGLGLGYGVSSHWYTELAVQYRRKSLAGTALDAVEWENILVFAEPNEWPVDLGLVIDLEQPRDTAEGTAVRVGALLQKEWGRFQGNANLLLGRHFQSSEFLATQIHYQAQFKYRYSRPLEFGVQAFGNLGSSAHAVAAYADQIHRLGPVLLGRTPLPGERSLSYNAALLFGISAHSPDRTLRVQIEYEF